MHILQYCLEVTLCWFIFFGLYSAFLRKETFFGVNRAYLLSAILLGLFIPFFRWINISLSNEAVTISESFQFIITAPELISSKITGGPGISKTNLSYLVITVVYLIGMIFFALRFLYGFKKIIILLKYGRKSKQAGYILVETDSHHLPFSFFHWVFLSNKMKMKDEFEKILLHELTHVKHRHSVDVLFLEILTILFWWNPLIFWYKKALRQIHEYMADAMVIKDIDQEIYGQILLGQSHSGLEIALAHQFFHSHLKKRFIMMYRTKSRRPALLKYTVGLAALLILALLFSSQKLITSEKEKPDYKYGKASRIFQDTLPSQEVFKIVEEMPVFPGCEGAGKNKKESAFCTQSKLIEFLNKNLKYPKNAKDKEVEGTVILQFVVENNGSVSEVKIIKDIGEGCGQAAKSAVESMNSANIKWTPGYQRGKAVRVQYTLPVSFKLPKKINEGKLNPPAPPSPETPPSPPIPPVAPEPHVTAPTEPELPPMPPVPPSPENEDKLFSEVERMPLFPGCNDEKLSEQEQMNCSNQKLVEYVYSTLQYPEEARKEKIEGMTIVKFVVNPDGSVSNIKLERDIGGGCGERSVAAVQKMQMDKIKWTPGYNKKGEAVNVQLTLPIQFKL